MANSCISMTCVMGGQLLPISIGVFAGSNLAANAQVLDSYSGQSYRL